MIVSQILGGLGNQMFQYAICRSIAEINSYDFKLDIQSFSNYKKRIYELDKFNIQNNIATDADINKCKTIYKESSMLYDEKMFSINDNSYLAGYWQNEKYIKNIREILLKEFTLNKYSDKFNNYLNNIDGYSVSIHIRRSDYITETHTNKYHGICSNEYYYKSLLMLDNYIDVSNILVFSDDKDYVKNNLDLSTYKHVYYIEDISDIEEMMLMSRCKHNIIANSTFSWWGAWLNTNPEKIVIAPKKWFNNIEAQNNQEIVPNEWIKI